KAESVYPRSSPGDRGLVERWSRVKTCYRRRHRHKVAEERKGERGVGGFAGNEHVVRPNEKPDDSDGDARAGDEGIAEDGLARKSRDDLADHAHGRKNHDVDGRVRIEPEEVLEENRVAAQRRIEETEMKHAFE